MELRPLGRSGLWVGRLGLGTMTWGRGTDEYEARDQLAAFLDAGGTLLDTADVYCDGASEAMLGELVAEFEVRDQVVLATKAVSVPGPERRFNASRVHLLRSLETSLRRLRTDTIDGEKMYVLELTAVDRGVTYAKVLYWVRQSNNWPHKAEFYSLSDRLLKVCRYEKYQNIGGRVRPTQLVMEDALKKGEGSTLRYSQMTPKDLPDRVFTKQYMDKLNRVD